MTSLFELSTSDLYSLLQSLRINSNMKDVNPIDRQQIQSKVTEWLLINGLSTLHKFEKDVDGGWVRPREEDCVSCKFIKGQHKFTPSLVVTQPTVNGETLITFDVKTNKEREEILTNSIGESRKDYYGSLSECCSSCLSCWIRPFRNCTPVCSSIMKCLSCRL